MPERLLQPAALSLDMFAHEYLAAQQCVVDALEPRLAQFPEKVVENVKERAYSAALESCSQGILPHLGELVSWIEDEIELQLDRELTGFPEDDLREIYLHRNYLKDR